MPAPDIATLTPGTVLGFIRGREPVIPVTVTRVTKTRIMCKVPNFCGELHEWAFVADGSRVVGTAGDSCRLCCPAELLALQTANDTARVQADQRRAMAAQCERIIRECTPAQVDRMLARLRVYPSFTDVITNGVPLNALPPDIIARVEGIVNDEAAIRTVANAMQSGGPRAAASAAFDAVFEPCLRPEAGGPPLHPTTATLFDGTVVGVGDRVGILSPDYPPGLARVTEITADTVTAGGPLYQWTFNRDGSKCVAPALKHFRDYRVCGAAELERLLAAANAETETTAHDAA